MIWLGSASGSPQLPHRRGQRASATESREKRRPVAANGAPPVLEARPKNERDDGAVAANAFFHAIRLQIAVVHHPARAPQQWQIAAAKARGNRRQVSARSLAETLADA